METAAACCVHSSMANSQSLPGIMSAQKVVRVRGGGGGGGEGAAERRVTFSGGASSSSSSIGFNRSEQWGSTSATTIAISSSKRGGRSLHTTVGPLKVVCKDYPRPDIDMTANFLEAAALSAFFRSAPRPTKPLNVVIAGAGEMTLNVFFAL
jgi:hypothetical protein